jgi:DNA-binding GntR family transcriptional regulator
MTAQPNRTDETLDYTTLCDAVANRLRQEILSGALKPGQKLDQTSIANRFGISRMPIRDAFRILEGEGLVRLKAEKGAFVAKIDLEEFIQIYQVREVLEALAIRLSVPHMRDHEVKELADSVVKMEEAAKKGELGRWVDLDRHFHLSAYQKCQNPTLLKVIIGFWNSTQQYRRIFLSDNSTTEDTLKQHKLLLEAIRGRDGELAAQLMTEHIRGTVRALLQNQHMRENAA